MGFYAAYPFRGEVKVVAAIKNFKADPFPITQVDSKPLRPPGTPTTSS